MNRRWALFIVAFWAIIVAICLWRWNVLGRCPNWTHDHHPDAWVGWLLAACFAVSWMAIWLADPKKPLPPGD